MAQALTEFADDVGIPDTLLSDGAQEMVGPKTEFMKEVNRMKIRLKRSEVGRSNQNYAAEREIGKLKKAVAEPHAQTESASPLMGLRSGL